ncbi:MAG: hypothetical protein GEU75_01090 [Dehalococcoidia bacterium]|nr:hypothetical protein [Dehalococcoidia bacterium]
MSTKENSWLSSYRHHLTRRRFLSGAAVGASGVILLACSSNGSSAPQGALKPGDVRGSGSIWYARNNWNLADETDQAVPGGVYPGHESRDVNESFEPFIATDSFTESFHDRSYEYLLRRNRGPGIAPGTAEYLTPQGNLAADWEISDDALSVTFTMREGVKFHPIAPVNAREMSLQDWRSSWERFMAVGSNRLDITELVDKVEWPDARHMVMKLKVPYGPLPGRMMDKDFMFKIVPKELVENPDLASQRPIGTNYRILDKIQPSSTSEFRRHDAYWAGKPFVERWHYPVIPEYSNRYAQFVAKNIVSFSPNARDVLKLHGDARDAILEAAEISTTSIRTMAFGEIDKNTVPWRDSRVRIAIQKSVNWDGIADFLSNRGALTAAGIEPEVGFNTHVPMDPAFWLDPRKGELGEASKNYLYDPVESKKLLAAAGHASGIDLGMLIQIGNEVDQMGLLLDEYNRFGLIRIIPREVNRTEFFADGVYSRSFQGIRMPYPSAGTDVDYLFYRFYHGSSLNVYPDAKLDELIDAQRRAIDPLKRAAIIKDLQLHIATTFCVNVGSHPFSTWNFEWPWLHNVNQTGELQWLDPNMPRRNG